MNENLNLIEILKDCPRKTKLYSPLFGEVKLNDIHKTISGRCVIECESECGIWYFNIDGTITIGNVKSQIILLYPSKDQQDWSKFKPKQSKFDPKTLQPFDKVLAFFNDIWRCDLYSHYNEDMTFHYECLLLCTNKIIPYNEDTKHLVDTPDDAPEFYRFWED